MPDLGNTLGFLGNYEVSKSDITPGKRGSFPAQKLPLEFTRTLPTSQSKVGVFVGQISHFPREIMKQDPLKPDNNDQEAYLVSGSRYLCFRMK